MKDQLENITDDEEKKKTKEQIAYYKSQKSMADKMQLPLKILGNSFFGSYGSGSVFPWSDIECAEETTCRGRQMLRLMISHFSNLGSFNREVSDSQYNYQPIVGDSFTSDTPLFIKYDSNDMIDVKPISELIDKENIQKDVLGREYDYSTKDYTVLCRSGWVKPTYLYRHKTTKDLYRIEDNSNFIVDVTEDHSLYNEKQVKIKPADVDENTIFEEYEGCISVNCAEVDNAKFNKLLAFTLKYPTKIPIEILNANLSVRNKFAEQLEMKCNKEITIDNFSKTFVVGYYFIKSDKF